MTDYNKRNLDLHLDIGEVKVTEGKVNGSGSKLTDLESPLSPMTPKHVDEGRALLKPAADAKPTMMGDAMGAYAKTVYDDDYWTDEDDEGEEDKEDGSNWLSKIVSFVQNTIIGGHSILMKVTKGQLTTIIVILAYFTYFIYAMIYEFGSEGSRRLLVCTILGVIVYTRGMVSKGVSNVAKRCYGADSLDVVGRQRLKTVKFFSRWIMYGLLAAVMIYTLVAQGLEKPENLRSLPGLFMFLLIPLFFSTHPSKINWHTIYWSVGLQFLTALMVLKWDAGREGVMWLQSRLDEFFAHAEAGSKLLFGDSYKDHYMIFGALPIVFFTNATITILYYLGAIQFFVRVVGSALNFILDTSPVESMAVTAGIFMEGITAILALRPYLGRCSKSQLFVIITSIFSSLGGAYLAILSQLGVSLTYLIPGMVVSAPATFAVCKLMVPETKWTKNDSDNERMEEVEKEEQGKYANVMDAAQSGAMSMLTLVGNVAVVAFAFFTYIEFINNTLEWFGDRVGVEALSIELIFSYLLFPMSLAMGIDLIDCRRCAMLLGYRIGVNNIIAFFKLGEMKMNRFAYIEYMTSTNYTGSVTYTRDDIILDGINKTLTNGFISERSEAIVTYSLCGFSSCLTVAIVIGIMFTMVPHRKAWIAKVAFPCLIAGNIANCMTGCFASIFY